MWQIQHTSVKNEPIHAKWNQQIHTQPQLYQKHKSPVNLVYNKFTILNYDHFPLYTRLHQRERMAVEKNVHEGAVHDADTMDESSKATT